MEHRLRSITHVGAPVEMLSRVVNSALELIERADGAAVEVISGPDLIYVCAGGLLSENVGTRIPLATSLSGLAARTGEPQLCVDTETDPRVDRAACRRNQIRSMVCVPLLRGQAAIGVLKMSSRRLHAFESADVELLNSLGSFVATVLFAATDVEELTSAGSESPGLATQSARFMASVLHDAEAVDAVCRARIEAALGSSQLLIVWQPVVELATGRTVGAEALSRFQMPPQRTPDLWFAEAESVGLGVELELMAVRAAIATLPSLPADAFLAINVSAATLLDERLPNLVAEGGPKRLVLELTEHTRVADYEALCAALAPIRAAGGRVAVDDAGAGFSSLSHILRLAPDIIKIDRALTTGLGGDAVRQAMVAALATFAERTGAEVIAEGIETAAELASLVALEIRLGQGYYLARPAPVDQLPEQVTHLGASA